MKTTTLLGKGSLSLLIKAIAHQKKSSFRLAGAYVILTLLAICGNSERSLAQEPDTIYQHWLFLGEDTSRIDVSYRVVKCTSTSANQVHLSVFNENPTAKPVSFTVTVKDNSSNATTTQQVSYQASAASMDRADCSSGYANLKINLPSGYNPGNITVSITF
jgi:hypothetical protein